ncbi:YadA-like family protein, partial [Haemophilus haemolyticus]
SDQVRNTNKVNFVGTGIATVTGETDANGVRTITVNVSNGLVDVAKNEAGTETGAVTGPKKAAEDALKAAQAKLDELNNKPTATDEEKKAAQDAVNKAQSAVNNAPSLIATAENVADMINKSGFNLKTSAAEGQKVKGTKDEGELINPGETVEMVAGKNMSVKQDENGKVTYATKDDVEFNTVKIANPNGATYTDKNNNPLVKADDGKYYPADQVENGKVKDPATATPVEADKVTTKAAPSVEFKAENATPATNNTGKDKDGKVVEPTTALNISSDDGKPTQLKGVGSVLNTTAVPTAPEGTKDGKTVTPEAEQPKLVNLEGKKDPKTGKVTEPLSDETLNSAATVRDIVNMGWIVSAKDGNGYTDVVKNANKVDFKGGTGITITGKTLEDGTRQLTVGIKEGEVTDKVTVTHKDGTKTEAVKIGDNYYKLGKDGKPEGFQTDVNGKPAGTPLNIDKDNDVITNSGSGFVTGNTVATAIQESGWNVGLADSSKANEAFNDSSKALSADKLEKVNPDDNVRFADGKNTKVQAATMDEVNKDGKKITNTYVRFNVDLPISQITSEDKDGNKVAKAADGKWYPVKEGKPDTTKEALEPSNVRTSASMDPDSLGDKYTSTTSREEGLTPTQLGELTGKQEAAAKAAEEKIKDLLKGQSKDVIEAASKAAVDAAKEEAKVQYLKDNGLDKGTGGTVISNVAWGTKPSDAVNVDQLQNSGINVHSRTVEGSTGKVISGNTSPTKVKMDETVNVDAGNNIEITRNGRDIAIATSMTPQFDSVQFGDKGPKITNKAGNINVSGPDGKTPTKITGVAPGEISATSKDAINGSQLHAVASNLNNKINKVGKHADAGTASALAAANIPQAYTPGKSLVGIAAGNYQGQNGLAVGMSRISDNGKIIIRLSGTANSQGKTGVAAGVGYQW